MWEWYRIGVAAGIGAGVAVVAAAWLARTRPGALLAILIGAAGGIAVGFALGDWKDALGGAIGGVLGGLGGVSWWGKRYAGGEVRMLDVLSLWVKTVPLRSEEATFPIPATRPVFCRTSSIPARARRRTRRERRSQAMSFRPTPN